MYLVIEMDSISLLSQWYLKYSLQFPKPYYSTLPQLLPFFVWGANFSRMVCIRNTCDGSIRCGCNDSVFATESVCHTKMDFRVFQGHLLFSWDIDEFGMVPDFYVFRRSCVLNKIIHEYIRCYCWGIWWCYLTEVHLVLFRANLPNGL